MRAFASQLREQYLSELNVAKSEHHGLCKLKTLSLLSIALLMGCIALVGNLLAGYQFGFLELNAMSQYLPSVLLENVTVFGDSAVLMGLVLIFAPKHARFHWTVILASVIGGIAINVLKDYFAMPRPPAVLDAGSFILIGKDYHARSFPSGHSFTAFLMATVCFLYCQKSAWRWVFMGLAALTAISRVWVGVHWPADILIGGMLGILVGIACMWLANKWHLGLHSLAHVFSLTIIFLASQIVFFAGNDYHGALPMMYTVATLAVVQFYRHYLCCKKA